MNSAKGVQQKPIRDKKILLVTDALQLGKAPLIHAINLGKRMDASLEILHLLEKNQTAKETEALKEWMTGLKPGSPIGYIQLTKHRGLTVETVGYAKNRRNILCVILVIGNAGPWKKGRRQARYNKITKLLDCPVVLYQEDTPSSQDSSEEST